MGAINHNSFNDRLISMTLGEKIELAEKFTKVTNKVPEHGIVRGNAFRGEIRELIKNLGKEDKTFSEERKELLESTLSGAWKRWKSNLIVTSDDEYFINLKSTQNQKTTQQTEKTYHKYLNDYLLAMSKSNETAKDEIAKFLKPSTKPVDVKQATLDLAKKGCRVFTMDNKTTRAFIESRLEKGLDKETVVKELMKSYSKSIALLDPKEQELLKDVLGEAYEQLKSPKYASTSLLEKLAKIGFSLGDSMKRHSAIKNPADRFEAMLKECQKQIRLTSIEEEQLKKRAAQTLVLSAVKQPKLEKLFADLLEKDDYDVMKTVFEEKLFANRDVPEVYKILKTNIKGLLNRALDRALDREEKEGLAKFCSKVYVVMNWSALEVVKRKDILKELDINPLIDRHAPIQNLNARLEAILKECDQQIALPFAEKNRLKQKVAQALAVAQIKDSDRCSSLLKDLRKNHNYDVTKALFHKKVHYDPSRVLDEMQTDLLKNPKRRSLNKEEERILDQYCQHIYTVMAWPFFPGFTEDNVRDSLLGKLGMFYFNINDLISRHTSEDRIKAIIKECDQRLSLSSREEDLLKQMIAQSLALTQVENPNLFVGLATDLHQNHYSITESLFLHPEEPLSYFKNRVEDTLERPLDKDEKKVLKAFYHQMHTII